MRNKIRINEATFKRIIAESVKGVLNEISPELKAAAAMTAAKRANRYAAGSPKFMKYVDQSNRFTNSAEDDFQNQNPTMTDVYLNPYNRTFSARFNGRDSDGNTIEYYGDNNRLSQGSNGGRFYGIDPRNSNAGIYGKYPENQVTSQFSNRDLNRYEKFQDQCRDVNQRLRDYQPKD